MQRLLLLSHAFMNCASSAFCTEVANPEPIFGEGNYVGHDEPSTLFYSNVPGSGNRAKWDLTLPKDPTATNPLAVGKSYNFELHAAFWFGMAMCDTQSYPELLSTCTPDSDKNIVDPALSCNRGTGIGCTLIPETDDGAAAVFYPFFSTRNMDGQCVWQLGNHIPGNINDFHQNQQYGTLLNLTYTNGTGTESLYEDFRQIFNNNPCKAWH